MNPGGPDQWYYLEGAHTRGPVPAVDIAHLVQRPQERIAHALLLTSDAKGIGKSSLGKVIRALVGERNSRVAQTKDLKGQFDGWIVGKLVVQVDEIYLQPLVDKSDTMLKRLPHRAFSWPASR